VDFQQNQSESESGHSVQSQFDLFYTIAHNLLEMFYPERTVTITTPYITCYIKSMLRRKNRLMRRGRVEELGPKASALAQHIGKKIIRRTKTQLKSIQGNADSKKMWTFVRRLTGKKPTMIVSKALALNLLTIIIAKYLLTLKMLHRY